MTQKWHCTSYRKRGALSLDGVQAYDACFRRVDGDGREWQPGTCLPGHERASIRFAAHSPSRALRLIVDSGRNPLEFADTVVD